MNFVHVHLKELARSLLQVLVTVLAALHLGPLHSMVEGRIPPIGLQETQNPASRPFTLEVKVQRPLLSKMPTWQYFLTKATNFRRKFGSDRIGNPNYDQEAVNLFPKKKKDKILAVRLEELFWARNEMGRFFFHGLWARPLEASH